MTYELYTFSGTPFGWRIQLAALIKGVELNVHWIQPSAETLKSPDFLAMNPRGKVPVLKTQDLALYESTAIVTYLDAAHPHPPLFGETVPEKALIAQTISEIEWYLSQRVQTFARGVFFDEAADEADHFTELASMIMCELDMYGNRLGKSDYLVGGSITAADVHLYPLVRGVLRAGEKEAAQFLKLPFPPIGNRYPNMAQWMERIESIPNFQSTWPPGWK